MTAMPGTVSGDIMRTAFALLGVASSAAAQTAPVKVFISADMEGAADSITYNTRLVELWRDCDPAQVARREEIARRLGARP